MERPEAMAVLQAEDQLVVVQAADTAWEADSVVDQEEAEDTEEALAAVPLAASPAEVTVEETAVEMEAVLADTVVVEEADLAVDTEAEEVTDIGADNALLILIGCCATVAHPQEEAAAAVESLAATNLNHCSTRDQAYICPRLSTCTKARHLTLFLTTFSSLISHLSSSQIILFRIFML